MIDISRFCLNRKAAPAITLDKTIPLVANLGIKNIELRNDLYGAPDNTTILDHLPDTKVKQLLDDNNVAIETINAVGNMDSREMIDTNLQSLKQMLEMTKNLNLRNIVFCPVRSQDDQRSAQQRQDEAVANVQDYSQLLKQYNVNGLIEPLGFLDGTLRFPWEGQAVIDKAGVDNFKLVADTFHYYLANVTETEFHNKVDVSYIGLVHLSSVLDHKEREKLDDQDRYMLDEHDIMDSVQIAHNIETAGYQGLYAFEPFSDDLKQYDEERVQEEISRSIELVQQNI
ncbi:sugar phosphate isomerase/epimerase family protein [Bombilactobacillus mellis]|uniref:sugar phosphate isomerase/epimerase family protein n=1 Tax=Bombilactobacillus mellis TaxID=1218508 RepID=UPI0022472960|nr:TIM barrel protein [Bombilactobacillus mellis]MCX0279517.1 TIM barrel protein [Bombilactobacillus mellis]